MKIWNEYGTEHSANLVMIGKFQTKSDAVDVLDAIERVKERALEYERTGRLRFGDPVYVYDDSLIDFLYSLKVFKVAPNELEQFISDVTIEQRDDSIWIRTNEFEVSAFMKLMFERGARIEIYSAHHHDGAEEE